MKNFPDSIRKKLLDEKPVDNEVREREAATFFQLCFEKLYPYWEGTAWDFNGTTTDPGKGTIACGYFVTTLLRDAGVNLNRIKLAQLPSFQMMKDLTSTDSIRNLSSLNIERLMSLLKERGRALYISGLDFHTGFILNDGNEIWFLHSNYINRKGVVKERLVESEAFRTSKSHYLTCLTSNRKFLRSWLFN